MTTLQFKQRSKSALIFAILFSSILAHTSPIECLMTENISDQNYETKVAIPISENGTGQEQISKSEGGMTSAFFQVKEPQAVWTLLDPETKKPLSALFNSNEGTFNRLQIIPASGDQYLELECARGQQTPSIKKPSSFACQLIEKNGTDRIEQKFTLPVAQNGHDIFPLPEAKLNPLSGWVLGYNGLIVIYFQNKKTYSGMTALGSWDAEVGLSWSPSIDPGQAILNCQPKF